MQRLHQKAREEAENGTGATKGPHPYEYQVSDSSAIPEAFRDANYDVSDALIQAHMQDCWNHNRQVIIKGLLIGQRV